MSYKKYYEHLKQTGGISVPYVRFIYWLKYNANLRELYLPLYNKWVHDQKGTFDYDSVRFFNLKELSQLTGIPYGRLYYGTRTQTCSLEEQRALELAIKAIKEKVWK